MFVAVLSAYHKPAPLFTSAFIIPVHAGRALAVKKLSPQELAWMTAHTAGDDSTPHISMKNPWFCELTVLYQAWKNPLLFGPASSLPDYLGLCHYRRFFDFSGSIPKPSVLVRDLSQAQFEVISSDERVLRALEGYDGVAKKAIKGPDTVVEQYRHCGLPVEDLLEAFHLAKEYSPQLAPFVDRYAASHLHYLCNMLVLRRELFMAYAEWLFSLLFALDERLKRKRPPEQSLRIPAYVAERLTGVYITWLQSRPDIRLREVPVALNCESQPFEVG